jgi:uncharacterized protein involved in exopolysaccharide biosynthesis
MAMMDSELSPGEAGELFDLRQARNVLGMVLRSVRRHWVRAMATFVTIFLAAVLLGYSTPKIFLSYSNLQLKPTSTNDLISPGETRTIADPRAGVKETVLAQANLRRVVQELNLVDDMKANEGLVSKLISKLRPNSEDPAALELDAISELRNKISVNSSTESGKYETSIAVTWSDPVIATQIAKKLQDNFIADRRATEVIQTERIVELLKVQAATADKRVAEIRKRVGPVTPLEMSAADSAELSAAFAEQTTATQKLSNATITLAAAKTDFDFRYVVSTEPEVPKQALNGRSKMYVLGFGAGALAALFLAAMSDLLKGSFIEPWQITRKLNIPVLAEVGE